MHAGKPLLINCAYQRLKPLLISRDCQRLKPFLIHCDCQRLKPCSCWALWTWTPASGQTECWQLLHAKWWRSPWSRGPGLSVMVTLTQSECPLVFVCECMHVHTHTHTRIKTHTQAKHIQTKHVHTHTCICSVCKGAQTETSLYILPDCFIFVQSLRVNLILLFYYNKPYLQHG